MTLTEQRQPSVGRVMRIAYSAANRRLRGQCVSITGYRGATSWDGPRIEIALIACDGSLSDERWFVQPGILINV